MSIPVKAVIAGSRSLDHPLHALAWVEQACLEACTLWDAVIVEVVSGKAPGIDTIGELFAQKYGIPINDKPADWNNITVPGALIRTRRDGSQYNVLAGHMRNEQMAIYGDVAILVWDGISTGTMDMNKRMEAKNKQVYVKTIR